MRESTTYQAILDEGRVDEAQRILLKLGRKLFGPPTKVVQETLKAEMDLERLERMCLGILRTKSWQDLLELP